MDGFRSGFDDLGKAVWRALSSLQDATAGVGAAVQAHPLETAVIVGILVFMAALLFLRRPRRAPRAGLPGLSQMTAGTRRMVFWTLVLLLGAGGGWAVLAPLASAAIATGVVSPEGARRSVQHFEGGIIRDIHVRDGDVVAAGDPLITLEDVRARADNKVLRERRLQLRAQIARLESEQAMAKAVDLPRDLDPDGLPTGQAAVVTAQLDLFAGRRTTLASRRSVLAQRIRQLEEETAGLREAISGQSEQLALIGEEISNVQILYDKGLARMPRLLDLKRSRAQVRIERAQNRATIARNGQKIGETEIEITKLSEEWRERAATELTEARSELAEVESRLPKTEDALRRTTIVAPLDGVVVELAFTTVGGVVRPGERILDVVPQDADLLIDARLKPQDIDDVRPGLPARVVLSAYSQRNTPEIMGRVRTVSADRIVDERSGAAYYLARVEVPRDRLDRLGGGIKMIPGMPAEVMIATGKRTFYDYLVTPIIKSFNRSFREH